MRPHHLLPLLILASCASDNITSMGRTRDAPPALMLTTALLGPQGETLGAATVTQEADGAKVTATVKGLPAGTYALHLHMVGKCDGPGFTTAGGHFNPTGKQHGNMNPAGEHVGDLPNITVGDDRRGSLAALRPGLRLVDGATPLIDADGATIVLHAAPDDYKTDPSGNSGARIACGILSHGKPAA